MTTLRICIHPPYIKSQAENISEGNKGFQSPESGSNSRITLFRYMLDFSYLPAFKSYFKRFNITPKTDFLWLQLKDHSVAM